jgi:predicted DNA binding CopG/RHH family protein
VGHPASIDLEKSIEKLAKGEKLDGAGGDDEDEAEDGSGYSQLDLTKIREEMGKWETKVEEISKIENVKNNLQQLMRDFVVVIRETKFDSAKDQFLTQYQNVNVLVGSAEDIEKLKPEVERFVSAFGGSFKSSFKI